MKASFCVLLQQSERGSGYFILVSIVSVQGQNHLCTPTCLCFKEVRCHFCVNIYIIFIRGAQLTGKICTPQNSCLNCHKKQPRWEHYSQEKGILDGNQYRIVSIVSSSKTGFQDL